MTLHLPEAGPIIPRLLAPASRLWFVLVWAHWCCGAADGQDEVAQDGVAAIRRDFREAASAIWSLSVEYEVRGYDMLRYPTGTFARKVLKAMTPCYLYSDLAHAHVGLSWKTDPHRLVDYVTESDSCAVRPMSRMHFWEAISADHALPARLSGESFFWATGIWPMHGRKGPIHFGVPVVLAELANEEKMEAVSDHRLVINGHSCIALKIGSTQNLWVDPLRGHCITRREFVEPDTGAMSVRYECADHTEVAAGVWLPLRIDVTYLGRIDDGRLRINVLEVNKLDKEAFQYEPTPGEVESQMVNGEWKHKQIRPGGLDHLNRMVDWVSQIRGLLSRPLPHNVGFSGVVARPLLFAAVLVFLSEVMYWVAVVRPNRSAAAQVDANVLNREDRTARE